VLYALGLVVVVGVHVDAEELSIRGATEDLAVLGEERTHL